MHSPAATEPARPPRRRWVTVLIPFAAFALGIGATFATARTRPEPFRGVYRQEAVAVTAAVSGQITAIDSRHGDEVRPGDPLVTLDIATASDRVQKLTAQRDALQRRLDETTAAAAMKTSLQIDELERQRLETQLRYADLLRARFDVRLRQEALENGISDAPVAEIGAGIRIRPVSAEPVLGESGTAQRRMAIAEAANEEQVLNTQIALCEERLEQIELLKNAIPDQVARSLGVDGLTAELAAIEASLNDAAASETSAVVASPAYGRVGIYRCEAGERVARGATLVEVFDAERPYILLTVPISALSELPPGRVVRVKFEGITTRKPLAGVVADVASEAERYADAATLPGSVVAQVKVKPVGRIWPTPPPGSTAVVSLDDVPPEHR